MVTLRTSLTTLTLFGASELLEFTVKLLNRPALGIAVSNSQSVDGVWSVGHNPVNVAVCGDYLEQSNQERQLFEFEHDAVLETVRGPVNVLQVDIALFAAERHQTVVLDGREEDHVQESNQLEVVDTGVPAIKQHGAGFDAFLFFRRINISPNRSFLVLPSTFGA